MATEFISCKFPDIKIKWSNKTIQEFGDDFFRQFNVIIGGLDNLDARRWINEKVHDLVEFSDNGEVKQETVIPYIDGGTEGFLGQSRVVIPYSTSCLGCSSVLQNQRIPK